MAAPVIAQPVEPMRLALIESMSGPFANTGEGVFHNLQWAIERETRADPSSFSRLFR